MASAGHCLCAAQCLTVMKIFKSQKQLHKPCCHLKMDIDQPIEEQDEQERTQTGGLIETPISLQHRG